MKKSLVLMAALACAVNSMAEKSHITKVDTVNAYQLQDVLVTSIRANKQTPVAYKNLNQKEIKKVNFGQDIPYILSLTPSITTTSDAEITEGLSEGEQIVASDVTTLVEGTKAIAIGE